MSTPRIRLRFNNVFCDTHCPFTGDRFTPDSLMFVLDDECQTPVCEQAALAHGFTIAPEDFAALLRVWTHSIYEGPDAWELEAADKARELEPPF